MSDFGAFLKALFATDRAPDGGRSSPGATAERPAVFQTAAAATEPAGPQRLTDSGGSDWRTDWRKTGGPKPLAPGGFIDEPLSFGQVCGGWTAAAWAAELRRKADRCDAYRPDIAAWCRAWGAAIELG